MLMMKVVDFLGDESGATAIEYALIAAFMAAMLILAMPFIANSVGAVFGRLGVKLNDTVT